MAVMPGEPATNIDPVTFEVIRNKLAAITEEQAITLKSVSGSPVVTDATDFNNGIYLADGSIVTMGPQVLFHTGTMSQVIRSIIEEFSENPGIDEGDMFMLNDPYRGAVHQHDITIVAPIFYEGECVAWTGSCAHQLDVGGMNFGSWSFKATEIQQEAMLLPGLKVVEDGEIREDVWALVMGMSRLPQVVGLDLKAMIAANNVAIKRFLEVTERYGHETVEAVMQTEIELSERRFRARLRQLPDGVFRAVDYMEHDGHTNALYEIHVAAEKRGDSLTFDVTGTSEQAAGFINCAEAGLRGALFTALLPILAPDIRWNEGLLRPVEIVAPDGIVCKATFPAPVSMATVGAMWVTASVANTALSRMAACAKATRKESAAVTKGSLQIVTMGGVDRDGSPFGTLLLDATAGGGGAYEDHDGLDAAGDFCVPRPTITNVEQNESNGPLLYLYRRLIPDTAGPGRMRGGGAMGLSLTLHDVAEMGAMLICHGVEVPNSTGQFGGIEGSCNDNGLVRGDARRAELIGAVNGPEDLAEMRDVERLGSKPGQFLLTDEDAFAYTFQGGGGFGDPIEREAEAVAQDVEDEIVSPEMAAKLYGVALDAQGKVDEDATAKRRAEIRSARLGGKDPERELGEFADPMAIGIGHALGITEKGDVRCRCGYGLGPASENWKKGAVTRTIDPQEHGPRLRLHEELEMREHVCPGCGTLLESEIARTGAPDLFTVRITDPETEQA